LYPIVGFKFHGMKKQNPTINDDYVLWRRFRKGDCQAFNTIYNDSYPKLLVYGLKFNSDKEFVKDCIQEMFLDIMRRLKKLGDTDNILFYLIASLRRKILRKIQYDISFRYDENIYIQNLRLPDCSSEERLIELDSQANAKCLIRSMIDKLPPREKEAILMKFYLFFEYEDIATIMGVNIQSVRNLIYKAIKNLRKNMSEYKEQTMKSCS